MPAGVTLHGSNEMFPIIKTKYHTKLNNFHSHFQGILQAIYNICSLNKIYSLGSTPLIIQQIREKGILFRATKGHFIINKSAYIHLFEFYYSD